MTNYIYLLYGAADDCYIEAAYSIGTLLNQIDAASSRIIVFTDQPERMKDWPVHCESIAGQLEAMQGKANFSHRTKLCIILKCFDKYPGNVVYLDSDTSMRGDLVTLAERLSPGTAIMYSFECLNPEIGLSGFHTQLAGGISYRFAADSQMYNAGVIGLHSGNRKIVNLALELCDALLDFGSRVHTVEQFSISEALRISNIRVLEARGIITHYLQHKFYIRKKIYEAIHKTRLKPWQFEHPVPYSRWKVYWLRKFGYYLNPQDYLK
jgi:hypothetical protein